MKKVAIGGGQGFWGDSPDAAIHMIRNADIQYMGCDYLAELTLSIMAKQQLKDPTKGFAPDFTTRILKEAGKEAWDKHIKICTNAGGMNINGCVDGIRQWAEGNSMSGYKIGYVTGDNIKDKIPQLLKDGWTFPNFDYDGNFNDILDKIYNCNVYIGHEGIEGCLAEGADVVITGRVSDPAIFMAPLIHEFGWSLEDWDKLGKGTMVGHLLECGGQVTGGYFAEPGKKDVPGVGHLGFPIIEIAEDGSFFVTKVPEAGGMVTVETCSEQICYEIHDPEKYLTPDVVADFKQVKFTEVAKDKVQVEGATGKPKTETFKCSIGYKDCFIGDGEISYGGPGCVARAKLALEIVKERLELVAPGVFDELKFDLIGCNSLYWNPDYRYNEEPSEVRVRVAGRAKTKAEADLIGNEVEALYTNGPAGGCGAVKRTRDIVSVASILVSRYDVKPEAEIFEV